MSAWFAKVFKTEAPAEAVPAGPEAAPEARRVVEAPLLAEDEAGGGGAAEGALRIRARLEPAEGSITFLPDAAVLPGCSFWCPDRYTANAYAPLAAALYDAGGVATVLIHDATVTVTVERDVRDLAAVAKALGAQLRAHLLSGMPVVHPEVMEHLPDEAVVRERLQRVIDEELNPGIAGHGGYIELNRVVGNTAYITMGGGCQGCAASAYTLKQGVHRAFREAVPEVGAILDETDHAAGTNPYFTDPSVLAGG